MNIHAKNHDKLIKVFSHNCQSDRHTDQILFFIVRNMLFAKHEHYQDFKV